MYSLANWGWGNSAPSTSVSPRGDFLLIYRLRLGICSFGLGLFGCSPNCLASITSLYQYEWLTLPHLVPRTNVDPASHLFSTGFPSFGINLWFSYPHWKFLDALSNTSNRCLVTYFINNFQCLQQSLHQRWKSNNFGKKLGVEKVQRMGWMGYDASFEADQCVD